MNFIFSIYITWSQKIAFLLDVLQTIRDTTFLQVHFRMKINQLRCIKCCGFQDRF